MKVGRSGPKNVLVYGLLGGLLGEAIKSRCGRFLVTSVFRGENAEPHAIRSLSLAVLRNQNPLCYRYTIGQVALL